MALGVAPAARAADDWDATVAAAIKEGEVHVHGGFCSAQAQALAKFKDAYPQIALKYTGATGRDSIRDHARTRGRDLSMGRLCRWDTVHAFKNAAEAPAGAFGPLPW